MVFQRRHDAGAQVRHGRDVEDDAPLGELLEELGVLDRADAVADPVGVEGVEGAADRLRAGDLARMRHGPEPVLADEREDIRELLRRIESLLSAKPDPGDPALLVPRGLAHQLEPVLDRGAARHVRGEQHLDAV